MGDIKHMASAGLKQATPHLDHFKNTVDVGAITITVGAVVELLPAVASLLSVLWMVIRIYETKTVQRLLGKEADEKA